MPLADRITKASVYSYARACVGVARKCAELGRLGYEYTIIPSRGAAPIESGALSFFHSVVKPAVQRNRRADALVEHIKGPLGSTLYLPFTADCCDEMEAIETADVRTFWVKVTAAIVKGDKSDPHYVFSNFVRDEICNVGFKSGLEDRVRSDKFVFIDTVVSGRAISEIMSAFDAEGIQNCHYILIIDENGNKLDPKIHARLKSLESALRVTLLFVDSLFTEDQGPAVSGIWCLTCPELMSVAREEIASFSNGPIGAGVYYHEVQKRQDESNIAITTGIAKLYQLMFQAVQIISRTEQLFDDLDYSGFLGEDFDFDWQATRPLIMSEWFDDEIATYLDHIHQHSLFDQATTHKVASPKILNAAQVLSPRLEVSSSHALRLHMDRDEAARLVRLFKSRLTA